MPDLRQLSRESRSDDYQSNDSKMEIDAMTVYDESEISDRLEGMSGASRAAFACACAQSMLPLLERFGSTVLNDTGARRRLMSSLDLAWTATGGHSAGIVSTRCQVEELVPFDDDWVPGSAYVQNAVAAIAYALQSTEAGSRDEALWAARQMYEAADYAIHDTHIEFRSSSDMSLVEEIVHTINELLRASKSSRFPHVELRRLSMDMGKVWQGLPMDSAGTSDA